MVVALCEFTLSLAGNDSLKGKRSVVRGTIQRVQNKFHISVAEVDDNDALGHAVLGFAVVGNNSRFVESVATKVLRFVDNLGLAELTDDHFEVFHW